MKTLDIKLGKERQSYITVNKTLVRSFFFFFFFFLLFASVNITILGLTNRDVNLKRMHQLYIVENLMSRLDCLPEFL